MIDFARSRAVLLGSWSYDDADLPDVPAARNSMDRMRSTLTSSICGWPRESITVIANPDSPGDLPDRIVQQFTAAEEVALFYFVGHGQVDEDDHLCLCLAKSVTRPPRRSTTSLGYEAVRRAMLSSPARIKIVILDCCYSGIATEHSTSLSGTSADLAVRARASGVYTMAASGPYGAAWFEPTGERGAPPLTYFTKYFVDVLREGIAGQPAALRLSPIFREVHSRLKAAGKPSPTRRASDTADEFDFARNLAPALLQRDPERENSELRQLLETQQGDLERAEKERARLADQLAVITSRLEAVVRDNSVPQEERSAAVESVRQEGERVAEKLGEAESRVRETQARVAELDEEGPAEPEPAFQKLTILPEPVAQKRTAPPAFVAQEPSGHLNPAVLTVMVLFLGLVAALVGYGIWGDNGGTSGSYGGDTNLSTGEALFFRAQEAVVSTEQTNADLGEFTTSDLKGSEEIWFLGPTKEVSAETRIGDCEAAMVGVSGRAGGFSLAVGTDRAKYVCFRPRIGGLALVNVKPGSADYTFDVSWDYKP